MSEKNQSLTLAGRFDLCPCRTWPPVGLANCPDASGAGKVLQEERCLSDDDSALWSGVSSVPPVPAARQLCVVPPPSCLVGNS